MKSSVAGTYTLWFGIYTGTTQYYWTNYTINSADTWEKKVITVTGPTSGGVVSGTTGSGLRIEWTLGVGSDSETGTLNEWTSSNTFRTAPGSVYLNENAGATWYMTGAQFEVGSQATPYEFRSYGDELTLCQRYYQSGYFRCRLNGRSDESKSEFTHYFKGTMRTNPTVTTANIFGTLDAVTFTQFNGDACYLDFSAGTSNNFAATVNADADL